MKFEYLSTVNATLNFISFVFLIIGYRHIKAGRRVQHKKFMIAAFSTSCLFLISYLTYHANAGSVKFQGEGWSRPFYYTLLVSHIILAAAIGPMALLTLYRGLKGNYDIHKPFAKKTFPVWIYVSLSGVMVYLMLYHFYKK